MIEISGSIEGDKQLSRLLNVAPQKIGALRPVMFKFGKSYLWTVELNFNSKGRLFKERWPKRKDNKKHPLLTKTGKMRASFESRIGDNYVEIYNTADYFKFHQSNKPRHSLPRRVMLKITNLHIIEFQRDIQRHVQKALRDSHGT